MTNKKAAPAFELTDFDNNKISLVDYEGKQLYIKFWASWCSVCLSTLAQTNELSAEENDFKVITVVAPRFNGEKNTEEFKTWYNGLDYKNITALLDEGGKNMKEFGVRAFPSSAYISADGALIDFTVGHSPSDTIKNVFKESETEIKMNYSQTNMMNIENIPAARTIYLAGG